VVPGLVDPNLLNEHVARYRFAARFAAGAVVLDAGCGSGYGSAEFNKASSVVGIDVSAEAVRHAAQTFGGPNVRFLRATCEVLPFANETFDLVVAFEVIEHLEKWRDLLSEARRILRPAGRLLVSTPNKAYYAETRAAAGPNPFHVHEFEYSEFRDALLDVFPHVRLWSQNHSESIVFAPETPSQGILDAPGDAAPENAHFFLAVCSQSSIGEAAAYAWVPAAGNVLRERERHIALLEAELNQKKEWLKQGEDSHAELLRAHEDLLEELKATHVAYAKQNAGLEEELKTARAGYEERIAGLEKELKAVHSGYQERIAILEQEGFKRLEWVRDLESQLERARHEIERLNRENESHCASILDGRRKVESLEHELQRLIEELQRLNQEQQRATLELERTKADVRSLEAELQRMEAEREPIEAENNWLRAERQKIAQSKWLRLGRALGLGPIVKSD